MCTRSIHKPEPTAEQLTLQKRARSKALTNAIVYKLAALNSPLRDSYTGSYRCNEVIQQTGSKLTARYCNQRWCITCARMRTAKLIKGYQLQMMDLKQPYFMTLSARNVTKDELPQRLEDYNKVFMRIRKNLAKTYGIKLTGLRKIEVTYNSRRGDFHPHFHVIIDGKETAEKFRELWLNQWGSEANILANDIRKADKESLIELFKYVVKISAKSKNDLQGIDWIFQCLKGKRLTAAYNMTYVQEDINPEQVNKCNWIEPQNEVFTFDFRAVDWCAPTGEVLTGYVMDDKTRRTYENILKGCIDLDNLPGIEPPPNYYDPNYTKPLTDIESDLFANYYKSMNPDKFRAPERKKQKVQQLQMFN